METDFITKTRKAFVLNKIIEDYQNSLCEAKEELKKTWYAAIDKTSKELNDEESARGIKDFVRGGWWKDEAKDVLEWEDCFKSALEVKEGEEFGSLHLDNIISADKKYTVLATSSNTYKISRNFLARMIEIAN